ncbi:putative uncharacterized protein DDB_G0285119 [Hyposmocoma kahamanoa]|uniref:putative uncharacterized protein DDB_G0285119 n=1 Tax=Hyposmocoma kahamanoa TaxID=1477025 RepID=UPI000E6D6587|nr:putative uncharacterized protein DDB_G0285119 [Hyposmocoma kahamanoa]
MEVGAVKQAFNNELILLKKILNQAKIHIIHKLTRKAKALVEKKAPEPLKEKNKRKAESAINEVLIMKKIKARDIGKFILTHKGKLQDYLNKPQVDQEKACARLLLHKAMQDKYKFIRSRFSGVPINDLFMSRAERDKEGSSEDGTVQIESGNESEESRGEGISKIQRKRQVDTSIHLESEGRDSEGSSNNDNDSNNDEDNEISNNIRHIVKLGPVPQENKFELKIGKPNKNVEESTVATLRKLGKKQKDSNKNRNFNEKILNRKFKKDSDDTPQKEVKIVDPFFITSTGENYMSLAEPRAPDEVKEFHKEGNRKLRRAARFGHVPKIKPRQEFRQDNEDRFHRHNKQNGFDKRSSGFDRQNQKNDKFTRKDNLGRDKFRDNDRMFNKNDNFHINKVRNNQQTNFNDRNDNSVKPEKLHPSWEAKKRQSGILPFEGKKVVFNDD